MKLDADVRDEFTWNTKQLFMFLSVEYATPANPNSQLVMWSKIILSKVCQVLPLGVLSVNAHLPHALHTRLNTVLCLLELVCAHKRAERKTGIKA